ncbi:UNVERIFIED_CONTAM: hypothetical protein GTU68_031951 [Idotea baltica]|nr:hypothetical protein [Idotea baltica]
MHLDGSAAIGGEDKGPSPMQAVLGAMGGCSSIDIVEILKKMRQPLEHIEVRIEGTRRDETPRIFTAAHLHFILTGDLKEDKVKRAVDLSMDKYCSVVLMLRDAVDVTSSYEIKNNH